MLFLGCDSGATKAAFIVSDESGRVLAVRSFPGVSIVSDGVGGYRESMREYAREVLRDAGVRAQDVACAAFGLTGYGETRTAVSDMQETFQAALPGVPCILVNDSVTGWCGALRGQTGICIASGTGSVAYGEDADGNGMRAGGWSIRFADEGSAYWIAAQAIRAFFHQADGRMEKTPLYDRFLALFDVQDPLHACGEVETLTEGGRYSRVARLQREVLALYNMGDPCARGIYEEAAGHLCDLAAAIKRGLNFSPDERVRVTYTGGLFKAGACILDPLRERVEAMGDVLVAPAFGPLSGAVGYAARGHVTAEALERLMGEADRCAQTLENASTNRQV